MAKLENIDLTNLPPNVFVIEVTPDEVFSVIDTGRGDNIDQYKLALLHLVLGQGTINIPKEMHEDIQIYKK